MFRKLLFALLAVGLSGAAAAKDRPDYKLRPASGDKSRPEAVDASFDRDNDAYYTLYLPDKQESVPAVVICPGGAYLGLALDHEGHRVAEWYAAHGMAAVVLKYRMPRGNCLLPREDVLLALETVRANAARWRIDPTQVGVMGFSAGGHLASTAATHFTSAENRPDFAVLIYPVITMTVRTHGGSRDNLLGPQPAPGLVAGFSNEQRVTPRTPPAFIVFSDDDDCVDPQNGTMFYDALRDCGVPGELHIYPTGGHGWGWNEDFRYKDEVRASLLRWLAERTAAR